MNGTVHLVYGVGNKIFHCRSTDQGNSFDTPKEAFRVSNLSLGMRRGPRIAATENALVVTVIAGKQGKGRDGDLLAWRSTDGGDNWIGPVNVNDTIDSAREGLHGMAAGANGSIWCAWLDLRDKRSEVFAAKSVDGGATWQANVCVYRSPDGNVCECCHPSVAVGEKAVHVMFRNSLGGNRDMYVATSEDGGGTFAPAKKIGQGAWKLNACPMDGGMLAGGPERRIGDRLASEWRGVCGRQQRQQGAIARSGCATVDCKLEVRRGDCLDYGPRGGSALVGIWSPTSEKYRQGCARPDGGIGHQRRGTCSRLLGITTRWPDCCLRYPHGYRAVEVALTILVCFYFKTGATPCFDFASRSFP